MEGADGFVPDIAKVLEDGWMKNADGFGENNSSKVANLKHLNGIHNHSLENSTSDKLLNNQQNNPPLK